MKRKFGAANHIVAGLLAIIWLAAGAVALVIAAAARQWLGLVLGGLAVGYGVLWIRVARTGTRLRWPRRLR
jgi:hypothetical protein